MAAPEKLSPRHLRKPTQANDVVYDCIECADRSRRRGMIGPEIATRFRRIVARAIARADRAEAELLGSATAKSRSAEFRTEIRRNSGHQRG